MARLLQLSFGFLEFSDKLFGCHRLVVFLTPPSLRTPPLSLRAEEDVVTLAGIITHQRCDVAIAQVAHARQSSCEQGFALAYTQQSLQAGGEGLVFDLIVYYGVVERGACLRDWHAETFEGCGDGGDVGYDGVESRGKGVDIDEATVASLVDDNSIGR